MINALDPNEIFENLVDIVTILDKDGFILYENNYVKEVLGYETKELEGRSVYDFINPDDQIKVKEKFKLGLSKLGTTQVLQFKFKHKNGSWIPLESKGKAIIKSLNDIYIVTTSRDISHRLELEQKLMESEFELQNIIDLLPVRIFWKDLNLNYLGCNKAFAIDAGKNSPKEMIGKNDFDMAWKDQADVYRTDDKMVIEKEITKLNYYEEQSTPSGSKINVITNKVPLKDKNGKIIGILGTYLDVTESIKKEKLIEQSEERYQMLADEAPLCIKWLDLNKKIITINKFGKKEHYLENKSDDDIKNWNFLESIDPKYHEIVNQSFDKALKGESSEFDIEHVPGTSTSLWCHSYLVPAKNKSGENNYVLLISRDISLEKTAELEKGKDLDELEKFKALTIGRELKMIELKKRIEELESEQKHA